MKINLLAFYLSSFCSILIFFLLKSNLILISIISFILFNIIGILISLGISNSIYTVIYLKTIIILSSLPFLIYNISMTKSYAGFIMFLIVFYIIFFDSICYTLFQKYDIKPAYSVIEAISFILPNSIIAFLTFSGNSYQIMIIIAISLYFIIITIYILINRKEFYKLYSINKESNQWKSQ